MRIEASDRGLRPNQETDQKSDPNGDTKSSFRSRTCKEPRPGRGDPIAKVGNPSGEENPQEQGELEPDGG